MKKKIVLMVLFILTIMTANVIATTKVTMEIVEDNICTINLNEYCSLEKKIIKSELEKHKITLQIKINNNSEILIPSGELMLVIDSSSSMNDIVEGETTRKDVVLESANKLVQGLLEANSTTLKIGVVTFSSSSEKDENGYFITGTEGDAQQVCGFTNDLTTLTNKISAIEGTGQYTNLDSGLKLANQQFSKDDTNKYMIILTDGLPNLAVGYNDLVTYQGLTDVITQTKSILTSLEGVEVITMLTGISDEETVLREDKQNNVSYTYAQVIQEVFGTEETPTKGRFYKINDTEIEETITEKIYRELLPVEKSLDNITIIDYIPQEIADNFNISLTEESNELLATISEEQRTITWNVEKLSPGETRALKFDLILKEKFDESIIDKVLDTNEKVDITYKDFDGTDKSDSSDVTPKIKLIAEDTAPVPIPDAGKDMTAFIFVSGILLVFATAIFLGYKAFKTK
ncbi:MAG: VWA domain-containing protein [Clostridia bacterium]|nr:VWA domain-containing protein [Clostridia bacterium]